MNDSAHEDRLLEELENLRVSLERPRRWSVTAIVFAALLLGTTLSPDRDIREFVGAGFIIVAVVSVIVIVMGHSFGISGELEK